MRMVGQLLRYAWDDRRLAQHDILQTLPTSPKCVSIAPSHSFTAQILRAAPRRGCGAGLWMVLGFPEPPRHSGPPDRACRAQGQARQFDQGDRCYHVEGCARGNQALEAYHQALAPIRTGLTLPARAVFQARGCLDPQKTWLSDRTRSLIGHVTTIKNHVV